MSSYKLNRDDVLACMMLKIFVPKYKDYEIIRSRDEEKFNEYEVLVDVGH